MNNSAIIKIGRATLAGSTITGPKGSDILPPSSIAILRKITGTPNPVKVPDMANALWGKYADYRELIGIRVQIYRLRKRLEAVGAGVSLKGKRNIGYWIEVVT